MQEGNLFQAAIRADLRCTDCILLNFEIIPGSSFKTATFQKPYVQMWYTLRLQQMGIPGAEGPKPTSYRLPKETHLLQMV